MAQETKGWGLTPADIKKSRAEYTKEREKQAHKELQSILLCIKKPELSGVEVLDALDKALFLLQVVEGEQALTLRAEIEKMSLRSFPKEVAPYEAVKKLLLQAVELSQPTWELRTEKDVHVSKERGHREARA